MNDRNAMIEETLRALLASNEALQVAVSSVRDGVATLQKTVQTLQQTAEKQQEAISVLQADVAAIKVGQAQYATKAEVEMVRSDLYKALEAQTWRIITLFTVVCSGLTAGVYYIARNVH
jgi:chromosome segregation ATPase